MDGQDRVGLVIIGVRYTLDEYEETDYVRLSIDVLVGFLSLEAILHCLCALSQGHRVYFRLVLEVLLTSLNLCVNIIIKEELCHFLNDVRSCG